MLRNKNKLSLRDELFLFFFHRKATLQNWKKTPTFFTLNLFFKKKERKKWIKKKYFCILSRSFSDSREISWVLLCTSCSRETRKELVVIINALYQSIYLFFFSFRTFALLRGIIHNLRFPADLITRWFVVLCRSNISQEKVKGLWESTNISQENAKVFIFFFTHLFFFLPHCPIRGSVLCVCASAALKTLFISSSFFASTSTVKLKIPVAV